MAVGTLYEHAGGDEGCSGLRSCSTTRPSPIWCCGRCSPSGCPRTSITWPDSPPTRSAGPTCGRRKPAPPGQMLCRSWLARSRVRVPGGQVLVRPEMGWSSACGLEADFPDRVPCVVPGLSRRESWWKDAEIFMLRHQLAVAQRERPRAHWCLTWPDRAWLALLAGTRLMPLLSARLSL